MKSIYISLLVMSILCLSVSSLASDSEFNFGEFEDKADTKRDKWDLSLVLMEWGVGALACVGAGALCGNLGSTADLEGGDEYYYYVGAGIGCGIGSAIGVILIGESSGKPTENREITNAITGLTSLIYPMAAGIGLAEAIKSENDDLGDAGKGFYTAALIATPVINPLLSIISYNLTKRERENGGSETGSIYVKPYNSVVKSEGRHILTVGFEVSI